MSMVFCRGCGKEIHDSAPACPHCGAGQKSENSWKISTALLVAGYVCSLFFVPAGIGIGIYALVKKRKGHGIAILTLSLFFAIILIAAV